MLTPYTRFKSSTGYQEPVIQHLNHQRGILSLLNKNINFNSKTGLSKLSILAELLNLASNDPIFNELTCMTLNCNTNNDLVIGGANSLVKVDLSKSNVISQNFDHQGGVSFMNTSSLKFLVLGKTNGALETFDPFSNRTIKMFHGHNGLLSDLDVLGNLAATCGYSLRSRRFQGNGSMNHSGNNSSGINSLGNNGTSISRLGSNGGASTSDYLVDPLVNIYDFRMMRPLSPIPFPAGASFVRFHPKLPNIIIIASTNGQMQFVDIYDHLNVTVYQGDVTGGQQPSSMISATNGGYLSNLNVSPNGEFLTFSDSHLNLHLWSFLSYESQSFNNFSNPLRQPDMDLMIRMQQLPQIPIDEPNFPLSSVGLPYYKDHLLSNFPTELKFDKELLKMPKKLDDDFVTTYEQFIASNNHEGKFMAYDKLKYGPRNVETRYESLREKPLHHSKKGKKTIIPKFISERIGDRFHELTKTLSNTSIDSDYGITGSPTLTNASLSNSSNLNTAIDDDTIFQINPHNSSEVPNCYTKLQIQYSKFGVQDFDFDYYNQTLNYCGLENHIDNSYINPLLQLYRFSSIFYNEITTNLFNEWLPNDDETINNGNSQGSSLLNELGYLFDMMYKAQSKSVTISNFSECFSATADKQAPNLINLDEGKTLTAVELRLLIINFNRFLCSQISTNQRTQLNIPIESQTGVDSILGSISLSEAKSIGCGFYDQISSMQYSIDLNVPPQKKTIIMGGKSTNNNNIVSYLDKSLYQYKTLKCQQCTNTKYHLLEVKQQVLKLPPLLVLNLNMSNQDFDGVHLKDWLVPEFYASDNKDGGVSVSTRQSSSNPIKYELLGYLCEISHGIDSSTGEHNLVSIVKVQGEWYLFNDFLVMRIPEAEVFDLTKSWKKPTIVFYQREQDSGSADFNYINSLSGKVDVSKSILYRDHFAGTIRKEFQKEYKLLTLDDRIPEPGSLVAIDAEFVTLVPEVIEIRSTGQTNIIKPKKLSLARISVSRGDGDENSMVGVPFIDDYIVHTKEIDDYLTSFSGISPGDLNLKDSKKNLVTLQTAYRRLWLLLNMGCIFVGHGLYNDFRCINIQVPKLQIRDTGDYYYLPEFKRRLSLKFLAYILLKEKVQTGNHDSIEDANTALFLYKKFLELKSQGEFESTLYNIYAEGQQLRFRVPDS